MVAPKPPPSSQPSSQPPPQQQPRKQQQPNRPQQSQQDFKGGFLRGDRPPPQQQQQQQRTPTATTTARPPQQQQQQKTRPPVAVASSKVLPPSQSWADDEADEAPEADSLTIITRLRNQMERMQREAVAVAKAQSKIQSIEQAASKHREEAVRLKEELEKKTTETTTLEKVLLSLRQTRDSLENERDVLKKSLAKAEKELKSSSSALEARVASLEAELAAENKQIGEDFVLSCPAGTSATALADSRGFSHLEVALVEGGEDMATRRALVRIALQRGVGTALVAEADSFWSDIGAEFATAFWGGEMLLFVSKDVDAVVAQKTVNMVLTCRPAMAKKSILVLEGFKDDHVYLKDKKMSVSVETI
jgi:hypothetical protein